MVNVSTKSIVRSTKYGLLLVLFNDAFSLSGGSVVQRSTKYETWPVHASYLQKVEVIDNFCLLESCGCDRLIEYELVNHTTLATFHRYLQCLCKMPMFVRSFQQTLTKELSCETLFLPPFREWSKRCCQTRKGGYLWLR